MLRLRATTEEESLRLSLPMDEGLQVFLKMADADYPFAHGLFLSGQAPANMKPTDTGGETT